VISPPALDLRGLAKIYPGGVVGLRPTDLTLDAGERLVLLGPSGSGKSTLLRLLIGLETADAGEIRVNGTRIDHLPPHKRGIALVPQRPALYPQMTVRKNLETVLADKADFGPAVEKLRIGDLLGRYPHQLSGGEAQRVVLAKLLLRKTGIWLLDEPFSGLDLVFQADFRQELHLLLGLAPVTILLVTHDPADAWSLGRRVGVLGNGELHSLGTAEDLRNRPTTLFVATAFGGFNLLEGRIERSESPGDPSAMAKSDFVSECGSVRVPVSESDSLRMSALDRYAGPTHRLTLGIRPEDVRSEPAESSAWLLVSAEPAGSGWLLTVARGRTRLRTEWRSGSPPRVGTPVEWTLPPERLHWFDGRTGRRLDV